MSQKRLLHLLARLEAGSLIAREREELEHLLDDDYEARELYLDLCQMEGLLNGASGEPDQEAIIDLPREEAPEAPQAPAEPVREVARVNSAPRRRPVAWWIGAAALFVLALIVWREAAPDSDETNGRSLVSTEPASPADAAPSDARAALSAEERYTLAMANSTGGASQAHPGNPNGEAGPEHGPLEFNKDIRPILSENCFQCHGPDKAGRKADLRLDTEDGATADLGGYAAIVKGDPDASLLLTVIHDQDPDGVMPPPSTKKTLTSAQKGLLKTWIEQGAPWQEHWAFIPPSRPDLPAVSQPDWVRNPIDAFILARLDREGLQPSAEATPSTLVRRLALDLTGLPAGPELIARGSAPLSDREIETVVDDLMGTLGHAEHLTWHWLEASRYADTDGYQNDGPRTMWRWRDWVIQAYRDNLPFDQFTTVQLAGDLLPDPSLDDLIATGFNRNHRYNSESGLVLEEFLLENAVDRVDTTSTVWMGMTASCARCHDHKYDPFSIREYYQMIDFFNRVPESGRAIKFGNSEPWILAPDAEQQEKQRSYQAKVDAAAKALTEAQAEIDAAIETWIASKPSDTEQPARPLLADTLSARFGQDAPLIATGDRKGNPLEKVKGLICNSPFSIAFHLRPEQVDKGAVLSNESKDTTRKGILVAFRNGHLRFHIISRWVAGVATLETLDTFKPGETLHVALTNDGSQRVSGMRIYIDGKEAKTRALHNTNSNKSNAEHGGVMNVGFSKHAPPWQGQVEDLRFFARHALTADEVARLAVETPIEALIARDLTSLSQAERAFLRDWFLEHAAPEELAKLRTDHRAALAAQLKYDGLLPTTMVMVDAHEGEGTPLRKRGIYHDHGERVHADTPAFLPPMDEDLPRNRLGFAQWLTDPGHPLTARVTVNRTWQMIFGQGLVKTAEDFGSQGQLPSHPELLDWLAVEFVESGWDMRHLLKLIVTSSTYRQESKVTPEHLAIDPGNRLLARAPRPRLPANVLRDQALHSSGLLVEKAGGPSVKPYQPARLWREASNVSYQVGKGEDLYRRSLYTYWKRTLAPPSMAVLDAADREWCAVKPKRTSTPLQALTLLNETGFFEAARKLGERMIAEGGETDEARIRFAFRTLTAREPDDEELAVLIDAIASYRETFAQTPAEAAKVLTVGDSKPAAIDPVELASAAALANVLYNLDEVITRE